MRARATRRREASLPAEAPCHATGVHQGRIGEGAATDGTGDEGTIGVIRSETLPTDLQAHFDESFRRNEAGLRYLANR